jgi:hypothetical protein
MAMKKIKDVVYSERYTAASGEEKTRYTNCGSLLQRDDGSMTIKLETIPVGFTGWLNCYDPKPRDGEQPQPTRGAANRTGTQRSTERPAEDFADELPPF